MIVFILFFSCIGKVDKPTQQNLTEVLKSKEYSLNVISYHGGIAGISSKE